MNNLTAIGAALAALQSNESAVSATSALPAGQPPATVDLPPMGVAVSGFLFPRAQETFVATFFDDESTQATVYRVNNGTLAYLSHYPLAASLATLTLNRGMPRLPLELIMLVAATAGMQYTQSVVEQAFAPLAMLRDNHPWTHHAVVTKAASTSVSVMILATEELRRGSRAYLIPLAAGCESLWRLYRAQQTDEAVSSGSALIAVETTIDPDGYQGSEEGESSPVEEAQAEGEVGAPDSEMVED